MSLLPDTNRFRGAALACLVTLGALLAPILVLPGDDDDPSRPLIERSLKRVRKETMAADAADQVTAGYYEDLFDASSRTISTNRLITGKWATNWSRYKGLPMNPTNRRISGFLYYDLEPDADRPEAGGHVITNSHGMADREYPLERPEGARRIAFIGDSITQGLGATYGNVFEALLEERLNAEMPAEDVTQYEVLNFGVGGYRITQMLWIVQNKVPAFHPQVDVVVFTDLTAFRKWGDHLVQLVHDGVDLEYPYLKELAAQADLRPDDDPQTFDAKLEPYRLETVRWALAEMKAAARDGGAELMLFLVPQVLDQEMIRDRFDGVREIAAELDIPVIDATDTFVGVEDFSPYRLGPMNNHPTDAGHAMIAENLWRKLQADPRSYAALTGARAPTP
ncbi:MAG TPA: SGNH/GDSL hydrolase family protein [bacterium]|nr:SGNH/GDSL hydrolase family protein [bacterium]